MRLCIWLLFTWEYVVRSNDAINVTDYLLVTASPGTELINGQQLNLTCTTGRPLPSDLRVTWFPPKEASPYYPLAHDHQSAHLTIPEVGRGDKGTWRCELRRADTPLTSAAVALNIGECRKWKQEQEIWQLWPGAWRMYNHYCVPLGDYCVFYRTKDKRVAAGNPLRCDSHFGPIDDPRFHAPSTQNGRVEFMNLKTTQT